MKRWVAISLAACAVIVLALVAFLALDTAPDNSKFIVGKPLAMGKVAPQIVVAESDQAVMLAPDGTLWYWGGSQSRQAGMFTGVAATPNAPRLISSPQKISEDKDWRQVTMATRGIVAIKADGSMWLWSGSSSGPRGPTIPVRIGTNSDWAQVSGLISHCLALKVDGSLWAWGQNESGQLGTGSSSRGGFGFSAMTPQMVGSDHDWKQVSAGGFNSYALKKDGTIWGWGSHMNGSSTNFNTNNVLSPEQIDDGTNWTAISAGDFHLLALKSDGTIWIRGQNEHVAAPATFASLKYGTYDQRTLMQIGKDADWDRIVSGQNLFYARKRDGSWWASGSAGAFQLGLGRTAPVAPVNGRAVSPVFGRQAAAPERLPFDFDPWAFSTGGTTSVLLTKDGSLWSWGKRLGASQSDLAAKGLRGLYERVTTWMKEKMHATPPQTPNPARPLPIVGAGRRGGPGAIIGATPNYDVTDYSPYRIWSIPPMMRKELEK